jgi:hypothetical protein
VCGRSGALVVDVGVADDELVGVADVVADELPLGVGLVVSDGDVVGVPVSDADGLAVGVAVAQGSLGAELLVGEGSVEALGAVVALGLDDVVLVDVGHADGDGEAEAGAVAAAAGLVTTTAGPSARSTAVAVGCGVRAGLVVAFGVGVASSRGASTLECPIASTVPVATSPAKMIAAPTAAVDAV